MIHMTLAQRVEELTHSYGNDYKHAIGKFVLEKKSKLGEYSTAQVADATYTSKAAVVRFAKSLGYSGWRQFTNDYVAEQRYQESHYSDIDCNIPFTDRNSTKDIIQLMCSLQMESLMDTADLMREWEIEEAVRILKQSRRIALFGLNPNNLMGELFRRRMLSIGRVVEIPSLGDSGMLASSLGSSDCAIIISYSGNSLHREPLNTLRFLEPNQVPVIAITSCGENYLRRHAQLSLTISSQEKLYSKISTFATETSIHYILNVVFSCYFLGDYQRNFEEKVSMGKMLECERFSNVAQLKESMPESK